jgi:hypothetical protein
VQRLLLLGLAAITVLAGGSLLLLSRLDGAAPSAPGAPAPPVPAPGLAAADPSARPPLLGPPPAPPSPAAAAAPPSRWDSIAPTGLQAWPQLFSALGAARPRLATCFEEATQASYGTRPFTAVGSPASGPGPAVLLLEVEFDPAGRLRLVDAPVEARGAEQDGLFSCVQEALRGMALPGVGAPGTRHRIRFPLSPTGVGAAAQPVRGARPRAPPG